MNIFTEIGKLWRKHREVQHTHHGEDLQLRGTWGEVGTTSLAHSKTDNATWDLLQIYRNLNWKNYDQEDTLSQQPNHPVRIIQIW